MDTRKYESPLGGDISLNKAAKGRGWKGLKGQAALALAVSLWIAGGSVASAGDVSTDTTITTDNSSEGYNLVKDSDGTKGSGVTFTVANGGKVNFIKSKQSGNIISIANGGLVAATDDSIIGGVINNQITLAGTASGSVYGGYFNSAYMSGAIAVTGNQVNINGGTANHVWGGKSIDYGSEAASNNHVEMNGGSVAQSIYGAQTQNNSKDATNNTVTINSGTVGGSVWGAYAADKATGNIVTIKDGTVNGSVYGGDGMGGSSGNVVNISGGTVGNEGYDIFGGDSTNGDVTGNQVIITGGTIKGNVYGGHSFSGSASSNSVTLGGGTLEKNVNGGREGGLEGTAFNGQYVSTGNALNLLGSSVVNGTVRSFETITLDKDLALSPASTVLSANKFENCGTLDITGATKLLNSTTPGTMTLLSSSYSGDFNTLNLTYNTATKTTPLTLNSTKTSQVVKDEAKTSGANGVTLGYNTTHTVSLDTTAYKNVSYTIDSTVNKITLGKMTWGTQRDLTAGDFDFSNITNTDINTTNFEFTNPESATGTTTLLTYATNLAAGTNIAHTQTFDETAANGTKLTATLSGNVNRTTAGQLSYTATGTTLDSVNLTGWDGSSTSSVPAGWAAKTGGISVTAGSTFAPNVAAGSEKNILTATAGYFSNANIASALQYKTTANSTDTDKGVSLTGSEDKGVKVSTDGKDLIYSRSKFNVKNISFGTMDPFEGRTASAGYTYTGATIDASKLAFDHPENITYGEYTLLTANNTLGSFDETTKNISYGYTVDGVTINGLIEGSYKKSTNDIKYSAVRNNATKLTFGNVEWKDEGDALIKHDTDTTKNIDFNGAAVDTTNINFTNIKELEANKKMTLVSDFGGTPGSITGSKYKVGSTLQGEGKASMDGDNLIFTADTTAEKMTVQEQTHNTVMGAEVGMAALSAGNDFVGAATEGLAMAGNAGADGLATYANMGGGSMNVETGSHVKTHTWNAILALGHKNEKKLSSTEYGAFFEYGKGNYTTYAEGDLRGDGSSSYTGGGILGKWQKNNGFYVEGSLRAGSIHDDAHNVLRDGAGNPYSYDTDATYWGAHIGVGREIKLNKTAVLDLYAKYFYNHRGSVSFDAGGHYDLGAVESSVLRVGTRYTVKQNDNINYYGGLAVEHEFCGRASGFADGVAIRGADISGTSVRGEIGATFRPGEKSNVTLDLNLSSFAGKKEGLTGGLSAVFHI